MQASNLPPGVSDAMIEAHFGGDRDDWPWSLECRHESAIDVLAEERDVDPSEVHDFDGKPVLFKDDETEELSSWSESWGASCRWTCPVCHEEHEEEVNKDDLYDE